MNHSMKLPKIIPTPSEGLTFFVFSLKSDLPEVFYKIHSFKLKIIDRNNVFVIHVTIWVV